MKTPERTTADVFPRYLEGEVVAESATLKWPVFVRRYRFPRVVDGFLVPATAEPMIACIIAGSAEFQVALEVGYTSPSHFVRYFGGRWAWLQRSSATPSKSKSAPPFCARIRQGPHDPESSHWTDGRWSPRESMSQEFTKSVPSSRPPYGSHVPVRNPHEAPTSIPVSRERIRPGRLPKTIEAFGDLDIAFDKMVELRETGGITADLKEGELRDRQHQPSRYFLSKIEI